MRSHVRYLVGAAAVVALISDVGISLSIAAEEPDPAMVEAGKAVVLDRQKGNCLACHVVEDGDLPGNVAPALISMQARFPDKEQLRAKIWDPTVNNPLTMMPPFGRHRILSEEEIDQVVEYIYTL